MSDSRPPVPEQGQPEAGEASPALAAVDLVQAPGEAQAAPAPTDAGAQPPGTTSAVDPGSLADLPPPTGIVGLELSRPLPHSLPQLREVLDAIAGDVNLHARLLPHHQRVMSLLPSNLLDAVRTHVTGSEDPLALATANAWRALVVAGLYDKAFGVDQPALQVLVDEAVDAREKVLAAALFSFDGAEASQPLAAALASAIDQLTEVVRFKPAPKRERPAAAPTKAQSGLSLRERFLRAIFAVTCVVTAVYHLVDYVQTQKAAPAWVVVGDPDLGHAVLAPGRLDADQASLDEAREELKQKGLTTTLSPSGEWLITRTEEHP